MQGRQSKRDSSEKTFSKGIKKKKISIQEIGNTFLFLKEVSSVFVQLFPNILLEVKSFFSVFIFFYFIFLFPFYLFLYLFLLVGG